MAMGDPVRRRTDKELLSMLEYVRGGLDYIRHNMVKDDDLLNENLTNSADAIDKVSDELRLRVEG